MTFNILRADNSLYVLKEIFVQCSWNETSFLSVYLLFMLKTKHNKTVPISGGIYHISGVNPDCHSCVNVQQMLLIIKMYKKLRQSH